MSDTAAQEKTGAENILWDLSVYYSGVDDPRIDHDMEYVKGIAADFSAKYKGRVAQLTGAEMAAALQELEALYDLEGRIATYASLNFSTNSNDPAAGALVAKYTEHSADVEQRLVFFRLEWLAADDESARRVLGDRALAKYRHYLDAERRFKPYQLSEAEEQIVLDKAVTGRNAWTRFYEQLMAAMRVTYEGEDRPLAEVAALSEDPDRDVRRKASDAITEALQKHTMQLTYIFNVLAVDKASDDKRRGYPRWISWRNLDNKVSDAVVDALVQTVTSSYDLVARHYRLKRKLLGIDELVEYDRHAPLAMERVEEMRYNWDEARETVLEAYGAFSPRMAEIAREFFEKRWIHAPVVPGKDSGAFCTGGTPSSHPFMLMNFTGRARDVGTLAHELGHGVHDYLAIKTQGLLNSQTTITIAETASTFGEMLVFSDLMRKEPSSAARLVMLSRELEYTFATIHRQIAFNRFEDKLHNGRREEGELPPERITEFWLDSIRAMFGDGLRVRDEYGLWWGPVLHFPLLPGYVYGYAFGKLLVLALYNLYKVRGESFVPQYLDLLAAGGSDYPDKLLAKVGVDLTDPAFWQQGIEAIREMVEQEEALAREVWPEKVG